ncbi:type II toxin-antitoxin system VapB family antitoxin [uncultured Rothia sp.]|uniref:type II toxin-antitoxin system VapB family antitoxin n=1 Tax=uncultured Rothia sp. TaxID=316088 RepID=UPI0032177F83
MIFKAVGDSRPYPEHNLSLSDWGKIAPEQVRLNQLITTQKNMNLETLLDEDSTFYGDLFPHVVRYGGHLYLEDGVHRALRSALQRRVVMYARILDLDRLHPGLLNPT